MEILAHQLLCALGSAVLATVAVEGESDATHTQLGFVAPAVTLAVAAAAILPGAVPSPAATGLAVVAIAATALARPSARGVRLLCAGGAGLLVSIWAGLLGSAEPLRFPLLLPLAMPALLAAGLAARRPGFAPPALREEALALVLLLGGVTAALPALLSGWHSAATLNAGHRTVADSLGPGLIVMLTAALLAGAGFAARRRLGQSTTGGRP